MAKPVDTPVIWPWLKGPKARVALMPAWSTAALWPPSPQPTGCPRLAVTGQAATHDRCRDSDPPPRTQLSRMEVSQPPIRAVRLQYGAGSSNRIGCGHTGRCLGEKKGTKSRVWNYARIPDHVCCVLTVCRGSLKVTSAMYWVDTGHTPPPHPRACFSSATLFSLTNS